MFLDRTRSPMAAIRILLIWIYVATAVLLILELRRYGSNRAVTVSMCSTKIAVSSVAVAMAEPSSTRGIPMQTTRCRSYECRMKPTP